MAPGIVLDELPDLRPGPHLRPRHDFLLLNTKKRLKRIEAEGLNDAQATALLRELVPDLLKVSKCPDFVVDRGHEFGSKRSDADKRALIEYLKTL